MLVVETRTITEDNLLNSPQVDQTPSIIIQLQQPQA